MKAYSVIRGDKVKVIVNSNCKKCPDYEKDRCNGQEIQCTCKFCPRNMSICIKVRWCRETESPVVFDE
jgi:hypothetical protein